MQRKTIFDRIMGTTNWVPFVCSVDGDGAGGGTTITVDGSGGGAPASSPASAPSGGGTGGGASDSSSSPAPAATPSVAPSAPADQNSEGFWDSLGRTDFDDDVLPVPAPTAPAVVPAPAPAPAPAAAPAAAAPAAPAAPAPGAPPAATPGAPEAATPMPSVAEPDKLAGWLLEPQNFAAAVDALSKDPRFALSEADVGEIESDVVGYIPKLAARIHMQSVTSVMKFMSQALPEMYKNLSTVTKANDEAETKFFGSVKGLDRTNAQHRQTAMQVVKMYRGMNPTANMDQVIQICGPMILQALGNPAAAPAAAHPGAPSPARPVAQAFQPAIGAPASAPGAPQADEWSGLGGQYDT